MNVRLQLWLCVIVASAIPMLFAQAQQPGARVALVIGNAAYPNAGTPLSSINSDAHSMADELRRSSFEVDVKIGAG
jgi:Caspase domain